MSIYDALKESHDTQRRLVDLLVETEGDSEGRSELFAKLTTELDNHAAAEERHFYVPLMEADLTQEQARHSIAEHQELDELVAELRDTDFSSPGWLATAKTLREQLHHHLDEEEHEVFQQAGKVLSDTQVEELGEAYREHMAEMG